MTEEYKFNLSERIFYVEGVPAILAVSVKEFITLLKDKIFESDTVSDEQPLFDIINKLAGDKLI